MNHISRVIKERKGEEGRCSDHKSRRVTSVDMVVIGSEMGEGGVRCERVKGGVRRVKGGPTTQNLPHRT